MKKAETGIVTISLAEETGTVTISLAEKTESAPSLIPAAIRLSYHQTMAKIAETLGFLERARIHLQEAIQIEPENPSQHVRLGYLYKRLRDHPGTESHLRQAVNLGCNDPDVLRRLGKALMRQGKYQEAGVFLDSAILASPNDARAYILKAVVSREQGALEESLELLDAALRVSPSFEEGILYHKVETLVRFNPDQALFICKQILSKNPEHLGALLTAGKILSKKHLFAAALPYFDKRLESGTDRFITLYESGRALFNLGEIDEAFERLQEAHEIDSENVMVLLYLGAVFLKKKDLDNAEKCLLAAAPLDLAFKPFPRIFSHFIFECDESRAERVLYQYLTMISEPMNRIVLCAFAQVLSQDSGFWNEADTFVERGLISADDLGEARAINTNYIPIRARRNTD